MANNCLFTKLKGVVNNDSLKIFGAFKISANCASSLKLKVQSTKAQNVKVLEGFVSIRGENVSEFTVPANTLYTIFSDVSRKIVLLFSDKYSIVSFESPYASLGFDLEDLKYSDNLHIVDCAVDSVDVIGDVSSVENLNLIEKFNLDHSSKVTGNISTFSGLTTLTELKLSGCNRLEGDIESFGNLTSLISLRLGETVLGGTLESLVKAQVGNGRTSGSIVMGYLKTTNVTFNGVKPNDNEATLTWEPNSEDATKTDITYNGVSVTIDNE